MKSRTSFFNGGLFCSTVRRYWPLWVFYFIGMMLVLPVTEINSIYNTDGLYRAGSLINDTGIIAEEIGIIGALIMSILSTSAVFSFLYSRRSTGLYGSLPVKREAIFISSYLAGLLPILAINLLTVGIELLVAASALSGMVIKAFFETMLVYSMYCIIFYSLAVLAAVVTGRLFALPIVYIIFNFLSVILEAAVNAVLAIFIYGFTTSRYPVTDFLSPAILFIECADYRSAESEAGAVVSTFYTTWSALILWLAGALIITLLALLIFKRRRAESCGVAITVPVLKPVFKYLFTVCASIGFALLMYVLLICNLLDSTDMITASGTVFFTVCAVIGAAIGYFALEMLLKRSLHVFDKTNMVRFLISALCCVLFILGCSIDVFGVESMQPKLSEIESASLDCGNMCDNAVVFRDEESIKQILAIQKTLVENKREYTDSGNWFENYVFLYAYLTYTLKDGSELSRVYSFAMPKNDPTIDTLEALFNNESAFKARTDPGLEVSPETIGNAGFEFYCDFPEDFSVNGEYLVLSDNDAYDLYVNGILPDIESGALGYVYLTDDSPYYHERLPLQLYYSFSSLGNISDPEDDYGSMVYINYYVNADCEHIIQWFIENRGIDIVELAAAADYAG